MAGGWLTSAWAMVVVIGCTRDEAVTVERCTQLRDHVVETRLKTLANIRSPSSTSTSGSDYHVAGPLPPTEVAGHRAAMQQALGDSYIANCMKSVTSRQLTCALAANDATSMTACLSASSRETP